MAGLPRGALALLVTLGLFGLGPAFLTDGGLGQAGGTDGNLVIEDPAGDILVEGPVAEAMARADIIRLETGFEDHASYGFVIDVLGSDSGLATVSRAAAVNDIQCSLRWTFGEDGNPLSYYYSVRLDTRDVENPGAPLGDPDYYASAFVDTGDDYDFDDITEGVTVHYDPDETAYVIQVLKAFTPVFPDGRPPADGDFLRFNYASCRTDIATFSFSDSVQHDGERYKFRSAAAGDVISLAFSNADGPAMTDPVQWTPPSGATSESTMAAGELNVLPLFIENNAEVRKLVELEARFLDEGGDWNLSVAPNLFLGAGENRTLNLLVRVPADAAAGEQRTVRVTAKATGEDLMDQVERTLKVVPLLGPKDRTFYLHTLAFDTGPLQPVADTLDDPYEYGASQLRDDPAWPDDPTRLSAFDDAYGYTRFDPLARPVAFDAETPARLTIALQGPETGTVQVHFYLYSAEVGTIASFNREVPANGVHTLETFIPEDALQLSAGDELGIDYGFQRADTDPDIAAEVVFDPRGSMLELPTIPMTVAEVSASDGRFQPSLALAPGEDAHAYLNPGKQYAFEFELANDGIATDDLRVNVNATNATGWEVLVVPGAAFRVSPGNFTPLGVVVRAPAGTQEGHKAEFEVTARSTHDPVARARLILTAIVTTGVEIDEKPYGAREGQLAPLQESNRTPAPTAAWAAIAFVAVVVARRHRLPL